MSKRESGAAQQEYEQALEYRRAWLRCKEERDELLEAAQAVMNAFGSGVLTSQPKVLALIAIRDAIDKAEGGT